MYLSADNLTVDVDPCHDGPYSDPFFGSYEVMGCGASAFVVDARYNEGRCPYLTVADDYDLIRPVWFVNISREDRILNSGPGVVEAPPKPPSATPTRSYHLCVYATEDVEARDGGLDSVAGYMQYPVADQVIAAPPSLDCLDAQDSLDDARVGLRKARKKLTKATKQIRKLKSVKDKEPADRRALKKAKKRAAVAKQGIREGNRDVKDSERAIRSLC